MVRFVASLLGLLAVSISTAAHAQPQAGFDLEGPGLSIGVERGGAALPVSQVPSLHAGDRLTVRAVLPGDQSARYRLVVAFLRGATNPPPKDWFFEAETWRAKRAVLAIEVPAGAEQALVFLAPETGGGFEAVRNAVRGRPGVFVRAAQDLYLAGLDQARLDTFVAAIARIGDAEPERLGAAAPVLAKALGIKLNAECLSRPRALQAACLTQNRETLVLQAQRGSTLTETLTGAPVDLAYRIAATPEGGAGYYSPYIGLARDVARLFGAFRSAQYQYLPALTAPSGDEVRLRLNAAPSFQNPRSVLVAPLPPIGTSVPPRFQAGGQAPVCIARPDAVLPLEDAALLYATRYGRDLRIAVTGADGQVAELPVIADPEKGGVRLAAQDRLATIAGANGGVLRGRWGFDPFAGPRLPAMLDAPGAWAPRPDAAVIVGRDQTLTLAGGAAACVQAIALAGKDGDQRSIAWKAAAPDAIEAALPLARVRPGPLALSVARYGGAPPQSITLTARAEASRLDRLTIHQGDRAAMLHGARLDQVKAVELGGQRFAPGELTRGEGGDRLALRSEQAPALTPGADEAAVTLRDGRTVRVAAAIAGPRPFATIISREASYRPPDAALPIALPPGLVPDDGRLAFSFRVGGGPIDGVEVEAADGGRARLDFASGALQRVGSDVVVGALTPHTLFGRAVSGALRFRLLSGDVAGEWQPLAQVVRLPALRALECEGERCALVGRDLFLIAAIGETADPAQPVMVPIGFVGDAVPLPLPAGDTLHLRLHDAPDAPVSVTLPARAEE